ncbi:uncharacterized protein LOC121752599 [Salvia splendens]|uniref:uncharacterized protein LOC121752599 n=1 Tax=Salvia splendens TaxID=180675 RepID=UPI001C26D4C5|nr:uncharacterized protein LOC121752599 [Salvia splendens]
MRRELFLRIVKVLAACYPRFQSRWDADGKLRLLPLHKCTTVIRQMVYEGATDMFDEYLHVVNTTGHECLKKYCKGVIQIFSPTYLRKQMHKIVGHARGGARLFEDAEKHRLYIEFVMGLPPRVVASPHRYNYTPYTFQLNN